MTSQQSPAGNLSTPPSMPQKRVLPARERRESITKREASSPISVTRHTSSKKSTPSKATPKTALNKPGKRKAGQESTPTPRPSTPTIDEPLPTKITDSRPLPASHQPQAVKNSSKEYQTVAESAVLAASLHRSRAKWLVEGIFEKYWTKPSKKKGAEVVANNPDLKSMQKLGTSTILIGPHTFDAILYTVRENMPTRHPNQYPPRPVEPPVGFQPFQLVGTPSIKSPLQTPVSQKNQAARVEVKKEEYSSTGGTNTPMPKVSYHSQDQSSVDSSCALSTSQSGPDPVIRMLATRAASNPDLKALMKIVASSKATPEQLRVFQGHIDELNKVIRQQQETERATLDPMSCEMEDEHSTLAQIDGPSDPGSRMNHPARTAELGPTLVPSTQQSTLPPESQPGPVTPSGGHLEPPLHAPPYHHYPPQKMAMPEPLIKAIVLEFTNPASTTMPASQDRYLFPEYAVLDIPHSGQGLEMVCSFLITRKGSDIPAPQPTEGAPTSSLVGGLTRWKANEEYYQPVTMTMKSSQPRVLGTIARAAKPLQDVHAKMTEIMRSKTRVKDEWLALRLPREKGVALEAQPSSERDFVDSAVEIDDDKAVIAEEDDDLRMFYGF